MIVAPRTYDDEPGDKRAEALLVLVGRLDDLLVVGPFLVLIKDALVGDEGEGEHGHVAVHCSQHLGYGAHP